MEEYTLYVHINKINNKKYVGITKQKPEHRWGINGCNYKESPHFFSAILKYGWDNFEHKILQNNLSKTQACELEKYYIKLWDTQNPLFGYNITEGGSSPQMPKEVCQKISKKLQGNKNGYGHPCSDEKKEKIRQSQIGRKFSDEHKAKLSESAQKRHVPCSEEKKKKLSKSYPNKRKIYCEELDKVFDSVQQCGKELGIPPTNITKVCKGRGKTLKGYHFKYYDTINA